MEKKVQYKNNTKSIVSLIHADGRDFVHTYFQLLLDELAEEKIITEKQKVRSVGYLIKKTVEMVDAEG